MLDAALIAAIWGVDAEHKPLEQVAAPLSAAEDGSTVRSSTSAE